MGVLARIEFSAKGILHSKWIHDMAHDLVESQMTIKKEIGLLPNKMT